MAPTLKQTVWCLHGLSLLTFAVGLTMTIQILTQYRGPGNSSVPLDNLTFSLTFDYAVTHPAPTLEGRTCAVLAAGALALLASPTTIWATAHLTHTHLHTPMPTRFFLSHPAATTLTTLRLLALAVLALSTLALAWSWVDFYHLPVLVMGPASTPRDLTPESWTWTRTRTRAGPTQVLTLVLASLQFSVVLALAVLKQKMEMSDAVADEKAEGAAGRVGSCLSLASEGQQGTRGTGGGYA